MLRAAAENAVPVAVLYAVAITETGQRGALHPYAMNVEGRPLFSSTLKDALDRFAEAKSAGAILIDVGCMQVNHHFHGRQFQSIEDMFDPPKNVSYAAKFLNRLRASEGSWTAAVAKYHAGYGNAPAQRKYVCGVISNMVATGFGEWTQASKTFCRR
jgi:soluble lytic murein transglycosylase-like protein